MDPLSLYYFKENEVVGGRKVSPITDEYVENYPSVVDRFFTKYYYTKSESPGENYLVLFHSNRICLIGLAPEHIAFSKGLQNISFNIGNTDRSLNQVKGKGKKGGMILQEDSTLAIITAADSSIYKVPSCIRGKLIEVNERVTTCLELLSKEGNGYIAIVLPKPENCDEIKSMLLTHEQYIEKIAR